MRGTLETFVSSDQNFPTPNFSVGAIAGSIEGKADDVALEMVLGHATRDVRMVMLHAYQGLACLLQRPLGREVIRVQIVRNDLRPNLQNFLQVVNGFFEKFIALQVLQVAHMLTEKCVFALCETNCVLKFAANCEDGWNFCV